MSVLVVDTHVLVWWLEASQKLPATVKSLLDPRNTDLHLPVIVVAELVDLCVKGRTFLKLESILAILREEERFVIHDLTAEMAIGMVKYAQLPDIHDRCIVVTTAKLIELGHDALLVTRDRAIRDSGLVPTIWK